MAVETKLENINRNYVEIGPQQEIENKEIANKFVDAFIKTIAGEKPQKVKQGSAAEGLKVSDADEFDFLLAYNFADARQHMINAVESTNLHDGNLPEIPGYWRLNVIQPSKRKNRPWIRKWVEKEVRWYLAQDLFRRRLQSQINLFVEAKRRSLHHRSVKSYSDPSIANPAITLIMTKDDGKQISIDISVALNVMVNGWKKMFFAKKQGEDSDGHYWSVTRQDREIEVIHNMEPTIKANYRVAKYLLADVVQSSFILKTALLHLNQEMSHARLRTKEGFLKEMILYLDSAYQQQRLLRVFDPSDNILSEYGGQELRNLANEFRGFRNAIEMNNDMLGLIDRLLARAKK